MTNDKTPAMQAGHRIFKIRSLKLKELLNAVELNFSQDYITLLTLIEQLPKNVGAIFIEKSALETAYEEFMETDRDSD